MDEIPEYKEISDRCHHEECEVESYRNQYTDKRFKLGTEIIFDKNGHVKKGNENNKILLDHKIQVIRRDFFDKRMVFIGDSMESF